MKRERETREERRERREERAERDKGGEDVVENRMYTS